MSRGDTHVEANDAACHLRHYGKLGVGKRSEMISRAPIKLGSVMREDEICCPATVSERMLGTWYRSSYTTVLSHFKSNSQKEQ